MNGNPPSGAERRRPGTRWAIASLVLLVVGVGCLAWGLPQRQHPLAGPATSPRSNPTVKDHVIVLPAKVVSGAVVRSAPVTLSVPAIGLSVPVSELGLNPDGTVQVPTGTQEPGWYRLGPSPGQVGSAVILGHVDSYLGPAVFFHLRSLVPGDPVSVTLADGVIARFVVTSVVTYQKTQFPDQLVYGSHGDSRLQLVTCGGTFDSQTGHYLSNVVVYTSLVTTTALATTK